MYQVHLQVELAIIYKATGVFKLLLQVQHIFRTGRHLQELPQFLIRYLPHRLYLREAAWLQVSL